MRTLRSVLGLRGWKGRGRASDNIATAALGDIRAQAAVYLAARKKTKTGGGCTQIIEELGLKLDHPRQLALMHALVRFT